MITNAKKEKFTGTLLCWKFTNEEIHVPSKHMKLNAQTYL